MAGTQLLEDSVVETGNLEGNRQGAEWAVRLEVSEEEVRLEEKVEMVGFSHLEEYLTEGSLQKAEAACLPEISTPQ